MDQARYEDAINRLIAAAQLLVSGASEEQRLDAFGVLAFFQLRRRSPSFPRASRELVANSRSPCREYCGPSSVERSSQVTGQRGEGIRSNRRSAISLHPPQIASDARRCSLSIVTQLGRQR